MGVSATGNGLWRGGLARFLALYVLLYGAYGALSPILPSFLAARGLTPSEIGVLLAAAGALRIVAGPLAGRIADRQGAARTVLAASTALAGLATLGHLLGHGFAPLLIAGLAYALGTAAPAPLADALALGAARGGRAFQYGWVRAAGSAAFIAATAAAGALTGAAGLAAAVAVSGLLFLATAAASGAVPAEAAADEADAPTWHGLRALAGSVRFRRTVLAAALVVGAHALHDGFAIILWRASGIGAGAAGLLWSGAVAAEIVVFLLVGPPLLRRIGLPGGVALAAAAGGLRWSVLASTTALPWLAAAETLHGLSFALLHLACLGLIEASTPRDLRATALAVYGTFGLGLAGVLATLASGWLYGRFGASAFWAMAALSLAALPLAPGLRAR